MEQESSTHKRLIPLFAILFVSILVLIAVRGERIPQPVSLSTASGASSVIRKLPEPPLDIRAHAFGVYVIGEARPLLYRREWKPLPPASLTKLLTVALATELLPSDGWIVLSPEAKMTEEKRSKASSGEGFLRDDMIRLALVSSSNDAALALAEAVGEKMGGKTFNDRINLFVHEMSKKAEALGMDHSHFANPIGLDADSHYTSVEDLMKLVTYVWNRHRGLWEFARVPEIAIISDATLQYRVQNTNELLKEFPMILGGKTGYTEKANGALIFLYPLPGAKVASVIILGSEDRFGDGKKIIQWLNKAFKVR